jgi:hypothetical protein
MTLGTNALFFRLNVNAGVTFHNNGTFSSTGGGFLVAAGATFENLGSVTVGNNAGNPSTLTVPDGATLANFSGGTLTGGTWVVSSSTTQDSDSKIDFGTRAITTLATNTTIELHGSKTSFPALAALTQNTGTLRVLGGASFTPTAAVVNTAGIIELGTGGTFGKGVVVQSGGTLRATGGTVNGPVDVEPGGKFLSEGVGQPLTVTGPMTINGGSGTTWLVSFTGVAPNTPATASTQAGRVNLTGSANMNLVASSSDKITLFLNQTGGTLAGGSPVNYVIATATTGGNFQSNGGVFAFDPDQFTVVVAGFSGVESYSLLVDGNNLVLQFVPVPEPAVVTGIVAAGLVVAGRCRRAVAG